MIVCYVAGILLLFLSGVVTLPLSRTARGGERLACALVVLGSLLSLTCAVTVLSSGATLSLNLPWALPGGEIALTVDPLSALFLVPVFIIVPLAALYGLAYWPHAEHPDNGGKLRLFYGLIAANLALVLTARNALFFLSAWEIMALAGYFLVTTEIGREEARRAGFLYLVLTHTGTLALFALFILLAQSSGSFSFPAASTLPAGGAATAIFLLGLFGFGIKAGLLPLHIWLPAAHAAAPSHVSALLSGVMIKSGIYGLVRLTSFYAEVPLWWGWTVLLLGALSGVLGVVLALAQHDLKRLLAYHSVENIGIIALGLGLALIGRAADQPALVVLGLSGALLHVVNHGLFKALLFLGAGAVIHAVGSRDLGHHGGLLRRMPLTACCFLGGAVAISGLPPLNGFVSEWLIYLGLFRCVDGATLPLRLVVLGAPVLALIGGLALACFVKVFGIVFLGAGRTPSCDKAHEAPRAMLLPMAVLLALCALIGLLPVAVAPLLENAVAAWGGSSVTPTLAGDVAPLPWLSLMALLLLVCVAGLWRWQRRLAPGREARVATWGCGYALPNRRMQYSASSFAGMLTTLFAWALHAERHRPEIKGPFPPPGTFHSHTPDAVLDEVVYPAGRRLARLSTLLRTRMQHGVSGLYLLNVAITLCALLAAVLIWGGAP